MPYTLGHLLGLGLGCIVALILAIRTKLWGEIKHVVILWRESRKSLYITLHSEAKVFPFWVYVDL